MADSRTTRASSLAASVLDDLASSPTPYHAVARAAEILETVGYTQAPPDAPFPPEGGGRYLVTGGTLIAWWQPADRPAPGSGFCVVGAHTDSPNLRVRTNADVSAASFAQVGMEVYGGVLLNSWLDRDLGLAGRVAVEVGGGQVESLLYLDDDPILRIPQLAIHLDREIREKGLKLDPQRHLTPLWALSGDNASGDADTDDGAVRRHVAAGLGIETETILGWDLMAFDTQPPAVVGRDGDLFASARIDNLVSAFCATRALASATAAGVDPPSIPVVVLYDHEEIGSESATGAAGALLGTTLERIAGAAGLDRQEYLASLAGSLVVSADGAHATHPNYVDKHEPSHHIALNQGVVIKRNANQRYATDAVSEAAVVAAAGAADVPLQYYIHRNDLPCGSTIGPITAARLGVSTVDLGAPQLAMHSIREMAGLADLDHLHDLLAAIWQRPPRNDA
jgi:aspartyl aminopeptidase